MKAIILSAGQGRRLLPLTAENPKCLVQFSGRSLLEWQVRSLSAAGVDDITVVTGFEAAKVEAVIEAIDTPGVAVRATHNPFFELADNLASCWIARHEMRSSFLILNGDTLIEPEIARRVLADPPVAPITVTIDRKDEYDTDDMKVRTQGDRLLAIGKTLPNDLVTGESIGFLRFTDEGGRAFVGEIERLMRSEEGLKRWYLSAIDGIARYQSNVGVRSIEGLEWSELDFPADLERGIEMTAGWVGRGL
ncbi:sugar phosphate nucleotidyltransferase [Hansschlegelia quercus]|uniref:Phosphocholine cytidylyltransferase family protein n=1 Tax=Hansschlegelia quercus TaxID=2528245 RepID=A0A4Q9GJC9_9HYPH|nr:phosphocholine cytidylyltransferase family protein [Hansschlegelia quercus]TBN52568.1 phosphocholine cytidylyltransferase family protein [Hansschlegelia quercus]